MVLKLLHLSNAQVTLLLLNRVKAVFRTIIAINGLLECYQPFIVIFEVCCKVVLELLADLELHGCDGLDKLLHVLTHFKIGHEGVNFELALPC